MEKTHLVHPQLDALTLRVSVRALVGLGEKRQDRQYRGLEPRAQTHGRMLAKPALLTVSFDAGLLASAEQGKTARLWNLLPAHCRGVIVCFSLASLTSSRDLHGGRDGFARRRRHRRPITRGWGRSVRARHSGRRMRAARPLPAFRDSRGAPRLLPAVRAAGSAAHRSCACWRSWPSSVPR